MLTFLNSYLLPLLSLAGLPILIHLLTRHKVKEQPFSDLRFLEEIHRKRMRRMKLRQWLILILRTLIILFITSAFARPTIKGVMMRKAGNHENVVAAILLDNSYSTAAVRGGADIFTFQKAAANEILSFLREGDVAIVGTFNEKVSWLTPKPSRFFQNFSRMLDTISISHRRTDVLNAISEAQKMLLSYPMPNKEIYILTDNTIAGWRTNSEFDTSAEIAINILSFSPDKVENHTISAIEFPPQLLEIGTPFKIGAVVKNNGKKTVNDIVASLVLDGKKTSQSIFNLPVGSQSIVELSGQALSGGFHSGYVECSDDNLDIDNRRYLTFRIPEKIKVLIIGEPNDRRFFRLALSPEGETSFFDIEECSEAQLGSHLLTDIDVAILIDPSSISDAALGRLRTFASEGGGIFIIPGQRCAGNLSLYNKILNSFGSFDVTAVIGDTMKTAMLGWGKADMTHPVLSVFSEFSLPKTEIYRMIQFKAIDGRTFLHFENDMPAMIDIPCGDGRIIATGFSVDMRWSNLAISGLFVPMVHRVCQYLASDVAYFDVGYPVGNDISRTIANFKGDGKFQLYLPGGESIIIPPRFIGGKYAIHVEDLPQAGIYFVVADDETVDMFAANVVPDEGDLSPLTDDLKKSMPVKWLDVDKELGPQLFSARFGMELWRPLLIIALLLMLIEMAIEIRWRTEEKR